MINSADDLITEAALEQFADLEAEPCYVLSGSGVGWFLDPFSREMVMIPRGSELFPVDDETDEIDRVLVRSSHRIVLIPSVEIEEVGWN